MRLSPVWLLCMVACAHSEPFDSGVTPSDGPFAAATPSRLTYNSFTDSAASLTEDGQGVLYLYTATPNGDRCVGLLPPGGGTQRWRLCDERPERADSAKSFSAPALGSDGRLLYLQALTRRGRPTPDVTTLWLADSATPFARRELLSLPAFIEGSGVSWLTEAQWVGQSSFVARAGLLDVTQACSGCPYDTTITANRLVRGNITPSGATLSPIPGTGGVTQWSLAEAGASIVFTQGLLVLRVPIAGATPTAVATIPRSGTVTGISCSGSDCVLTELVTRAAPANGTDTWFYRVRLATTSIESLRLVVGNWAGPRLLPTGGDVVVQSSTGLSRDLYLFKGLLP